MLFRSLEDKRSIKVSTYRNTKFKFKTSYFVMIEVQSFTAKTVKSTKIHVLLKNIIYWHIVFRTIQVTYFFLLLTRR